MNSEQMMGCAHQPCSQTHYDDDGVGDADIRDGRRTIGFLMDEERFLKMSLCQFLSIWREDLSSL
jgi:hypothetical protein